MGFYYKGNWNYDIWSAFGSNSLVVVNNLVNDLPGHGDEALGNTTAANLYKSLSNDPFGQTMVVDLVDLVNGKTLIKRMDYKTPADLFVSLVKDGLGAFVVRKASREFRVGDHLVMRNFDYGRYTGWVAPTLITAITDCDCREGFASVRVCLESQEGLPNWRFEV